MWVAHSFSTHMHECCTVGLSVWWMRAAWIPCLSRAFSFDEIGLAYQLMLENQRPCGNMAALVNGQQPGLGASR